jgi:hypothetical protein
METWLVAQRLQHLRRIALQLAPAMSAGVDHFYVNANGSRLTAPFPQRSRIALVGPDMAEPRVRGPERAQDELGPEPVMQVGGMDHPLE